MTDEFKNTLWFVVGDVILCPFHFFEVFCYGIIYCLCFVGVADFCG